MQYEENRNYRDIDDFYVAVKDAALTPFYLPVLKPHCSESGFDTKYLGVIRSPLQTVRSIMDRVYKFDPFYMQSISKAWRAEHEQE